MKEEEQKQAEIDRINEEQKAVRAEQERQEIERAERAEADRREEQKEQDRREADHKEQDEKYYREKAEREEADRKEEQKRAEQERHRHQEPKPNPIQEQRQKVEYFEHWQDVKEDKQTEANRNYIYAQYAHAIERAETPQELKEVLAKSGIEMKRSEQNPRVYEYHYKDTKAESLSYMTDKKVYSNRPQAIKESVKKIEPPKKQLQR